MGRITIIILIIVILNSCNMFNNNRVHYSGWFSKDEQPIITAICKNDKETFKQLLKNGLNINTAGMLGITYLEYTVFIDNYNMSKYLLENGADPNLLSRLKSDTGYDDEALLPLETACGSKHSLKMVKLLVKYGANLNDSRARLPLGRAQNASDKDKIRYLTQCGADINKYDYDGNTIITHAALVNKWDMVEFLWDMGADPMKSNKKNGWNVAYWMQDYLDMNYENKYSKRIKSRLESIGVKFPYVVKLVP